METVKLVNSAQSEQNPEQGKPAWPESIPLSALLSKAHPVMEQNCQVARADPASCTDEGVCSSLEQLNDLKVGGEMWLLSTASEHQSGAHPPYSYTTFKVAAVCFLVPSWFRDSNVQNIVQQRVKEWKEHSGWMDIRMVRWKEVVWIESGWVDRRIDGWGVWVTDT